MSPVLRFVLTVCCALFLWNTVGHSAQTKSDGLIFLAGDTLSDLNVTTDSGEQLNLKSLLGEQGIVLYFYPKADTPGCTAQSCNYRDQRETLAVAGYQILGASADSPEALTAFKQKFELNFPLISDPKNQLRAAFGLKPFERSTVLISKAGVVESIRRKVNARRDTQEILKLTHPETETGAP